MSTTIGKNPGTVYAASEGRRFAADTTLVVVSCHTCGVTYAIPESFNNSAKRWRGDKPNGWAICCPFGHVWHYVGETELEREKRLRRLANDRSGRLSSQLDQTKATLRAEKAAKTRIRNERDRIKNRVANGVCPCCNRTFKQLVRHMKTQHPDYQNA